MPYDCKQDDFSSGPLESLNNLAIPPFWPSPNLEMILLYFGAGRDAPQDWAMIRGISMLSNSPRNFSAQGP